MINQPIPDEVLRNLACTYGLLCKDGDRNEDLKEIRSLADLHPSAASVFHVAALLVEIARLKRGDFTEEEKKCRANR